MRKALATLTMFLCGLLLACANASSAAPVNVAATATRGIELAALATAQAPTATPLATVAPAPVVVVVATPTPDHRIAVYLSQLALLETDMYGYFSPVFSACMNRGEPCETAVSTNSPDMITVLGKVGDLVVPSPCKRLQERALSYFGDMHTYGLAMRLASTTTKTQAEFTQQTKNSLDSLNLSLKIYKAEMKDGACQPQ